MATDIRIKYSIDTDDIAKAQVAFDKLTQEEQDALNKLKQFNEELGDTGDEAAEAAKKLKELGAADSLNSLKSKAEKLRAEIAKLSPTTDEFKRKAKELKSVEKDLGGVQKAASGAGGGLQGLLGKLGPLGPAIAGAFSIGAVISFGKAALDVTGRFQSMEAVLRNTLGSDSAAQGALVRIKEIAATTPFSVEELTQSFVKLANQGFKPTNQQIIALGDLAASTGKSFDQLAEALIDAQVGEFERLKEFGVRASKQGDQVKFTFKGVETTVRNSSAAIQEYIVSLGGLEGVMGAMGSQSATLEGSVSNLGDAWDNFLLSIGGRLGSIYQGAVKLTSQFLTAMSNLFESEEAKMKKREGEAYNKYQKGFEKNSTEAVKNIEANSAKKLESVKKETMQLYQEYENQRKAYQKMSRQIIGGSGVAGISGASAAYDEKNDPEVKKAKAKLMANRKLEADLTALNKASHDEIIRRTDIEKLAQKDKEAADLAAATAAEKRAKDVQNAINKEYQDRKKAIELQQKLEEEAIKQKTAPEGQDMARKELEMATNLELLKLAKEYEDKKVEDAQQAAVLLPAIIATQNKEITDNYKAEGDAATAAFVKGLIDRQIAAEDDAKKRNEANLAAIDKEAADSAAAYEIMAIKNGQLTQAQQTQQIQNQIEFNNRRIAENERAFADGVSTARDANDAILNDNKKLQAQLIALDKETQQKRQEIVLAGIDLANQVANAAFDNYQQRLQMEQDALSKRYNEELRLAGDNEQKRNEINAKREKAEKEIRRKQFEAQRTQAVANVIFNTAPIIAQYIAGVVTAPLAAIAVGAQLAQIAAILSQPVPEFAEGTKGKKFKGGKAIVGEKGTERIVTESGKVYYTPPTATLMDLPKGSQVIPNHLLSRQEIAYATMGRNTPTGTSFDLGGKLTEIGGILKGLPIHQINMDEKGFEKYIRTERRSTKVLNNKFPASYS